MRTPFKRIAALILLAALATPAAVLAADPDPHHPAQAQSAKVPGKLSQAAAGQIQERMHARMLAMRNTSDPQTRQEMMMAQMQDMTEMMAMTGSGCPMMGGQGGMMDGPMKDKPAK